MIRRGAAGEADARFEDGGPAPLRLRAETPEDLTVVSALLQDAVADVGSVAWMPRRHRLAALVSRFRWEDCALAARQGRPVERVRSLLSIEGALRVRANGVDPRDRELVVSVLALEFRPGPDCGGTLTLVLAGDGMVEVEVEALEVVLADVSAPYPAASGKAPAHPEV